MCRYLLRQLPTCLTAVAGIIPAAAADSYRKLSSIEIKAAIINMEISEPHFPEQYLADGTVRIVTLGRRIVGKWKISGAQLCIEAPKAEDSKCREIWRSGEKYQLRFSGDPVPFDVTIQKLQDRGW
jgi:hypothetical protein